MTLTPTELAGIAVVLSALGGFVAKYAPKAIDYLFQRNGGGNSGALMRVEHEALCKARLDAISARLDGIEHHEADSTAWLEKLDSKVDKLNDNIMRLLERQLQ